MEFTSLHGEFNSVFKYYSESDIVFKTIVRNEKTNKFIVFNSKNSFLEFYNKQTVKHYHEVIMGNQVQRFKMDIDINNTIDNVNDFINELIDIIITTFNDEYQKINDTIYLSHNDIIITDSSGYDGSKHKYSYHIIVFTYGLLNNKECKYLTNIIVNKLPLEYRDYIDNNVNKNIQNFRITDSTKLSSNRVKKISDLFNSNNNVSLLDTLIVPDSSIKILKAFCNDTDVDTNDIIIDDVLFKQIIEKIPSSITFGHSIRKINNNSILYNRDIPTHCTICDEIHHRDNSLIIQFNFDTQDIYEFCRQKNEKRFICNLIDNKNVKINIDDSYEDLNLFDKCEHKNIYSHHEMREYELVPTLVVKAQMKIGKTKMIHNYINNNFNDNSIIKFITFRQTFSNNIYNSFNDFELYSNITSDIISEEHKRIIIQVESLCRINFDNVVTDLLILDEVESVFSQISSGLHKHFNASLSMFIWLLKTSKYVICLDANISNRTYNILKKFRNEYDIFYHCNNYFTSEGDKYYVTENIDKWVSKIKNKINENKNIVIATNSINEAKICEYIVKSINDKLVIKLFSSETKPSEKKLYFNDVHKYWTDINVLIYTPTCTAGINFELEHFDTIFGFFCNTSCDVETCRQMLGRVRNVKTKEYYICLQIIDSSLLPTTYDEITEHLYNKRRSLYHQINDTNIQWYYTIDGSIKFYQTDYYYIWAENMIIRNKSKNDFSKRFFYQIRNTGALIISMDVDETDIKNNKNVDHKSIKDIIKDINCSEIAESPDISVETAEIIYHKLGNQVDVEKEELYSYKKFKLVEYYHFDGTVNNRFVKLYNDILIKEIYKNLCDITYYETISTSIEFMVNKERDRYDTIMSKGPKNNLEYYDLHNDSKIYVSLKHKILSKLLLMLNNNPIISSELYDEIINVYKNIIENYKQYILVDLNIKLNHDTKDNINRILKRIYGLSIYKTSSKYRLKKVDKVGNLFSFTSEKNNRGIVEIVTKNKLFLSL